MSNKKTTQKDVNILRNEDRWSFVIESVQTSSLCRGKQLSSRTVIILVQTCVPTLTLLVDYLSIWNKKKLFYLPGLPSITSSVKITSGHRSIGNKVPVYPQTWEVGKCNSHPVHWRGPDILHSPSLNTVQTHLRQLSGTSKWSERRRNSFDRLRSSTLRLYVVTSLDLESVLHFLPMGPVNGSGRHMKLLLYF